MAHRTTAADNDAVPVGHHASRHRPLEAESDALSATTASVSIRDPWAVSTSNRALDTAIP
jgi:hypothetical protein